jgi:hypothetical protein
MKLFYLFCFILLFHFSTAAQFNQLILRKNGIAQKRYSEGSVITIQTKLGLKYSGTIYLIQNDSVYFIDGGMHTRDIAIVFKKHKKKHRLIPFGTEAFVYSNLGIPLFTAGLTISGEPFKTSLLSGVALVYIPIIIYNAQQLIFNGNKKYRIGKKYDLQVLDFYPIEKLPQKK